MKFTNRIWQTMIRFFLSENRREPAQGQPEDMKYLITGLGNPGPEYTHTRHNIGFDVLDLFVESQGGRFESGRLGWVCEVRVKNKLAVCLKPGTFMNLSGKAVKYWADKHKIPPERVLVILDELALPLSKLRLKPSGSAGGHNGLKSIEALLGTQAYPRLRFGIGNNYPRGQQADYVLSPWEPDEKPLVELKKTRAAEAIKAFILEGVTPVMNDLNNKEFSL